MPSLEIRRCAEFLNLTRYYPPVRPKGSGAQDSDLRVVLLAVSLVFGIEILSFFGISLVVVQVAAGGEIDRPDTPAAIVSRADLRPRIAVGGETLRP